MLFRSFNNTLLMTDGATSSKIGVINTNNSAFDTGAGNALIGDANNTTNTTKLIVNDAHREIYLNSVDITSICGNPSNPQYTLPIQFINNFSGGYNYSLAGSWQNVRQHNMFLPVELFTLTNGFNDWRADFAINCRNMTDQTNKEYAMYIEIADVNGSGSSYQSFLFNQATPFTTHRNNSTYSASSTQSEN